MSRKSGWARIDVLLGRHPKITTLSAEAKWLYVASILQAKHDRTDGFVRAPVVCIAEEVDMEYAEVLVARGLWHRAGHNCPDCPQPEVGRGWVVIHGFLEWQESQEAIQARSETLSEAGRRGADKRWAKAKAKADPIANPNGVSIADSDIDIDIDSVSRLSAADLAKIAASTGGRLSHARKTAEFILGRAREPVRAPLPYVLKAIEENPSAYRYRRGNPKTRDEMCPEHVGEWRDACRACAIDARLKQPIGHVEVRETEQGLEVVAQYDEPNWLEDM